YHRRSRRVQLACNLAQTLFRDRQLSFQSLEASLHTRILSLLTAVSHTIMTGVITLDSGSVVLRLRHGTFERQLRTLTYYKYVIGRVLLNLITEVDHQISTSGLKFDEWL